MIFLVCVTALLYGSACALGEWYGGKTLNLDGYELVMYDEFEGEGLDLSVWEHRGSLAKVDGFYHPDQVRVENGKLVLKGEYTTRDKGAAWYSGMVRLKQFYTYGYYEIKCLPNKSDDFWSAFWLQNPNSYSHELSQGGVGGAEIDIFETYSDKTPFTTKNYISTTIHCNGCDDDVENIDSYRVTKEYVPNLNTKYTTFGLLWTEEEYIFYVNGRETARSSFGLGTSKVPEEVIVSLVIPKEIELDKSVTTEFLVEYVKVYQLAK
jgi:beta-glucanase (GH16 family)